MKDAYFVSKPLDPEAVLHANIKYGGRSYSWQTAPGVFQKRGLDQGTKLLLDCLEGENQGPFLDLGCGHGPLGLLHLARCPENQLVQSDVNQSALELTQRNAKTLQLKTFVLWQRGAGAIQANSMRCVMTNPPIRTGNENLFEMFEESFDCLMPGGNFYFVARAKQGVRTLSKRAAEIFSSSPEKLGRAKGFEVFRLKKT